MLEEVPTFTVNLEKKGRGRGLQGAMGRPWTMRCFRLTKQRLLYFDGETPKGEIDLFHAVAKKITTAEADDKPFPFTVTTNQMPNPEVLVLNAESEEVRERCIEVFNIAAKTINWKLEGGAPTTPAVPTAAAAATAAAIVNAEPAARRGSALERRRGSGSGGSLVGSPEGSAVRRNSLEVAAAAATAAAVAAESSETRT